MILIDSWPYDLMLKGELRLESDITEHEVEEGGSIVDHIRTKPIQFTLEAIVSNTPIGAIATDPSRTSLEVDAIFGPTILQHEAHPGLLGQDEIFSPGSSALLPSGEAHERLLAIWREKKIVTIEIPIASRTGKPGLRTFTNMALESLSEPYGPESDGGMRFSATFKEIRIVTNERLVRTSAPRGQGKGGSGSKSGIQVDKPDDVEWRMGNPPGAELPPDLPNGSRAYPYGFIRITQSAPGEDRVYTFLTSSNDVGDHRVPTPYHFINGNVMKRDSAAFAAYQRDQGRRDRKAFNAAATDLQKGRVAAYMAVRKATPDVFTSSSEDNQKITHAIMGYPNPASSQSSGVKPTTIPNTSTQPRIFKIPGS